MKKQQLAPIKRSLTRPYTTIDKILTPLSAVMCLVLVASGVPIDDKLIGLFGLLTIMLRINSKMSFGLALICLIDVPLLSIIGKQSLSEEFAVYAFYFLVIGVINSLLEDQSARDYLAYKAGKRVFKPIAKINQQTASIRTLHSPEDTANVLNLNHQLPSTSQFSVASHARHKKKPPLVSG